MFVWPPQFSIKSATSILFFMLLFSMPKFISVIAVICHQVVEITVPFCGFRVWHLFIVSRIAQLCLTLLDS